MLQMIRRWTDVNRQFEYFNLHSYLLCKRLMDIVISLFVMAAGCFAWPFAIFFVKFDSPGNVIYTQQRTGICGRKFKIYKLRTMYIEQCDNGENQAINNDPRITFYGNFLRKCYLDELPQFYNVLIGNMSLVGPRPHAVPMDQYYAEYVPFYYDRYEVKPGLTGLAQIRGLHGQINILQDMEERIQWDREYILHRSLWLDINIILKTLRIVFKKICCHS